MIGLAKDHPAIQSQHKIKEIDIHGINENNFVEVKGKKKRGGLRIQKDKSIGKLIMENGETYEIYGSVDGLILEINENVNKFIKEYPESKGYIGIVSISNNFKLSNE